MLDKKTIETLDALIKKIKDNNLGSIKLTNKSNTIEITNNSLNQSSNFNSLSTSSSINENIKNETNDSFMSIDSPMVGIIYLTPKPSSPPLPKKDRMLKKVIRFV